MILTSAQADAYRATMGPQPTVFIDETTLGAIDATIDDAAALAATWGMLGDAPGGRPGGYPADWLFSQLSPNSQAVADALHAVRHRRYADELLRRLRDLDIDYARAVRDAQAKAAERDRPQLEQWQRTCAQLANHPDPRAALSTPPRPIPTEPDMTAAIRIREQIFDVQREVQEVNTRRQALVHRAGSVLSDLAGALSRLLWMGPDKGPVPEVFDAHAMYEAYDVLVKHIGTTAANDYWNKAEARWKVGKRR